MEEEIAAPAVSVIIIKTITKVSTYKRFFALLLFLTHSSILTARLFHIGVTPVTPELLRIEKLPSSYGQLFMN